MADELVSVLVGFGRALRAEGMTVGAGDLTTFASTMAILDPTDLVDLYWGGRTSLVKRRDDLPTYDAVFRAYFLGERNPVHELLTPRSNAPTAAAPVIDVPATEPPDPASTAEEEESVLGLVASDVTALRTKSFVACTPEELAMLHRIMRQFRLTPPRRRTRRTRPTRRGRRPDMRRTVRRTLRMHGEPVTLRRQRRQVKMRPLVLILDVSGSMADYSRAMLQFAHTARRAAPRVEVFCFGTRLSRITVPLQKRSPDAALAEAARSVVDWEGGTRIGDCLDEITRTWGRRGLARGGVVVICSDGLDRGSPQTLERAMERLSRLTHTIVWMNPHVSGGAGRPRSPEHAPRTLGMMVAEPHIDVLLSGRDLESLAELARLLPVL